MKVYNMPDRQMEPDEPQPVLECSICNNDIHEGYMYFYDDYNDIIICPKDACMAQWAEEELVLKTAPTEKELIDRDKKLEVGL